MLKVWPSVQLFTLSAGDNVAICTSLAVQPVAWPNNVSKQVLLLPRHPLGLAAVHVHLEQLHVLLEPVHTPWASDVVQDETKSARYNKRGKFLACKTPIRYFGILQAIFAAFQRVLTRSNARCSFRCTLDTWLVQSRSLTQAGTWATHNSDLLEGAPHAATVCTYAIQNMR